MKPRPPRSSAPRSPGPEFGSRPGPARTGGTRFHAAAPALHHPGVRVRAGQYRLPDEVGRRVALGHPWVFKDALGPRAVNEPTGTLVELISFNRDFVGRGYVDQDHPVVVRCLTRDADEVVRPGHGTIGARFARAVQARWMLFGAQRPQAMRLFSGESEGLPGVTVDRYGDWVVVQWLSAGALPWRDELYEAIAATIQPRGIYEQKRLRPLAGQGAPDPAVRVQGDEAPVELIVEEAGCRYSLDVTAPLGVGFFPDMRLGHASVAARASGRRMLNLFSYSGAFALRAAKAGATETVSIDTAARAHARARRNFELSGLDPAKPEFITGDAQKSVERLAERGRRFDLVVCDPPTFSHGGSPGETFVVGQDLVGVVAASLSLLEPGGFLALATNSVKLSGSDLDRALAEAGARQNARVQIVERAGLPPDFPVAPGFPEGNYLKFLLALKL